MKIIILLSLISVFNVIESETPTVSVNYLPKKQWKLSKHDIADIKLDIEREMRSKILQVQMDWENRQRMEQASVYNQFAPTIPPQFFSPTPYPQSRPASIPSHIMNTPRFNEVETNESEGEINEIINKTITKIKQLKTELNDLKSSKTDKKITHVMNTNQNKNDTLNEIVKKYTKHQAADELKIFSKMFKNYHSTNTKDINIKKVNDQIQSVLKTNGISNVLDIQNNEITRLNKNLK